MLILNFGQNLGDLDGGVEITSGFLVNFLNNFACRFFQFALVILGIMFVVYGIMFLMSRGNSNEMVKARKALLWGIVGGLVIFGVTTIILSLAGLVGVNYDIMSLVTCGT